MMRRSSWGGIQEPDAVRPPWLLRARRERPRGRSAEQGDELASSQGRHGLSPPSAAGFLSLARRDRPVLGATLNRSQLGGRRQELGRSGRSQVHSFFVALLVCDLHGSSEMSLCHSGSDQALAVLVRTFPNAPVASANLATLSPLADSTTRSRSCSPDVR